MFGSQLRSLTASGRSGQDLKKRNGEKIETKKASKKKQPCDLVFVFVLEL